MASRRVQDSWQIAVEILDSAWSHLVSLSRFALVHALMENARCAVRSVVVCILHDYNHSRNCRDRDTGKRLHIPLVTIVTSPRRALSDYGMATANMIMGIKKAQAMLLSDDRRSTA